MKTVISNSDLTITETLCDALWQITLWPGVIRAALPADPGMIVDGVVRSGPQSWVVLDSKDAPEVAETDGTVTDLCHSRKRFHVAGALTRDVMMRLAPLDFRDRAFTDGAFKATSAHHISVWIARDGEAFDIWVGHTFADAFRDVLEETAAQWETTV